MKGLASVLDRFSEGLQVRGILPSLREEVGRSLILYTPPRSYPVADERPAPTSINPSQRVRDLHQPLPFAIRSASPPVVEAARCRRGTTAAYDDTP